MNTKRVKLSLLVSMLLCSSNIYAESTMDGLGDLGGGAFLSSAYAINSDGTVVIGKSVQTNGMEAFRWTQADGMVGLGDLVGGNFYSEAYAVNSDGSVVVGFSTSGNGTEAFRWTQADGMVALGDLTGGAFRSEAYAVSSDGNTVVGHSIGLNGSEAFRWTQADGMVGLGDLAGGFSYSKAFGVNNDGTVIVGQGTSASGYEAFRWTQADGMVGLGDLAGGSYSSQANAVNSDGSIVVGFGTSDSGTEAFRWTQADGMVGLGDLAGGTFSSNARAINTDGTVIVGQGASATGNEAFRWTQATGMQTLGEWLGVGITGWSGTDATGVSSDGNTVVGYGTSANGTEAFIAKKITPSASGGMLGGMIGVTDFTTSLESINGVSAQTISNLSTLLHGAHGHPGNRRAIDDKKVMWIAGDISSDNRHGSNDDGYIGEIGVSIKHSDNITYSVALGKMRADSKLDYEGSIDNDGEYIIVDTDIKLFDDIPLFSTTTLGYGKNDLTIKRGYDNGGSLTYSTGNTDQSFIAFKQRLQYQFDNFFPYAQFNHIKVKTDGYSESGGGFPVTYDKSKESVSEYRVGMDANFNLTESNMLITSLEAVHRVQDKGQGVSGTITGLGSFSIDGREYEQDWLRATVGLEHTFENRSRFTLTLNRTSKGEDATFWSGFNYSMPF